MIDRIVDVQNLYSGLLQLHAKQSILVSQMKRLIKTDFQKSIPAYHKIHTDKSIVRFLVSLPGRLFFNSHSVFITQYGIGRNTLTRINESATNHPAGTRHLQIFLQKRIRYGHNVRIQKQQIRISGFRSQIITNTCRPLILFLLQIATSLPLCHFAILLTNVFA